jgi:hypothetical protein
MAMFKKGPKAPAAAPKEKPERVVRPRKPSPPADIYVALMFVSTGALLTAFIFLTLELNRYGWVLP